MAKEKEVILMSSVDGLGAEGDVVRVADGFARNYLLPKKLAAPVTDATRRQLDKKRAERAEKETAELAGAKKLADRISGISCTIAVKSGPEGKLFGSVSAADIVAAVKEQGVELDRHQLAMEDSLRELGVFSIGVRLHPKVEATLKVWVVEE